jgi:hypothetical protein
MQNMRFRIRSFVAGILLSLYLLPIGITVTHYHNHSHNCHSEGGINCHHDSSNCQIDSYYSLIWDDSAICQNPRIDIAENKFWCEELVCEVIIPPSSLPQLRAPPLS